MSRDMSQTRFRRSTEILAAMRTFDHNLEFYARGICSSVASTEDVRCISG